MEARNAQGRRRHLLEGLSAGLGLTLADALATGLHRTPPRMWALMLVFGLALGLAAALASRVTRWRGTALAVVVAAAGALSALSYVSKDLGGDLLALRLAGPLAAIAAVPVLLGRAERGPLLAFVIVATVPLGSLARGYLPSGAAWLVATTLLPLIAALGARLSIFVNHHLPRFVLALAMVVALAGPSAVRDPNRSRPDLPSPTASPRRDAPDVAILLVDTLRSDAVDFAGEGFFARLAREGTRFEQCVSAAPWTLPSVSSILTGLYPSQHGATSALRPLPTEVETLAERFARAGYETAAFTGGAFVSPTFRLDQGFQHFDASVEFGFRPFVVNVPLAWRLVKNRYFPLRRIAAWVDEYRGTWGLASAARSWLGKRDPARPTLILAHTYEVHDYYLYHPRVDDEALAVLGRPSARFAGRLSVHPAELQGASAKDLAWFEGIYEHRISHVEEQLDALVQALESSSERDLVVALVSDHGEGWDAVRGRIHHGGRLHDDLLLVPLVLRGPGVPEALSVVQQVRTVDLAPTLLALAGLDAPREIAGRSLVPLFSGDGEAREAWGEEHASGLSLLSLRKEGWKLHRDTAGLERAYELAHDPFEDVATRPPASLSARLAEFTSLFPARQVTEGDVDEATLEHLRALGYAE